MTKKIRMLDDVLQCIGSDSTLGSGTSVHQATERKGGANANHPIKTMKRINYTPHDKVECCNGAFH